MKRLLCFLTASVLFTHIASAQGVDENDAVVSLSAKVVWGDPAVPSTATASMACYALSSTLGTAACESQATRGSGLPDMTVLAQLNTRLIPGVRYTVLMRADNKFDPSSTYNGIPGFYFAASAPAGYVVELEQVAGCETYFVSLSRSAQTPLVLVHLRVLAAGGDPGLPAGMATPLSTDKKLWQISLGDAPNGGRAGTLSFNALASSASLASMFTRQNFSYDGVASSSVLLVRDTADNQSARQIIAPQVCVDVIGSSLTSGNIELRCYHASQRPGTTDANGYFTFTGSPFATYLVQPQSDDASGVIISGTFLDLGDASTQVLTTKLTRTGTAPAFTWTADGWHTGTSAVSQTIRARTGMSETLSVQSGSTVALTSTRTYTSFGATPLGDEITQESNGSTNPVVVNYSFYTDQQQNSYGRPLFVWNNGGSWSGTEYNTEGRPAISYGPFADTDVKPTSLPASSGTVTTYTYSADPWGRNTRIAQVETQVGGVTTAKSAVTYSQETPFASYTTHPTLIVLRSAQTNYSTASASLTTVTKQFYEAAEDFYRGQIHSIERPDKAKQSFAYQHGTWNGTTFTPSANDGLDEPAISTTTATRIAAFTGTSDSSAGTACSSYGSYPLDTLYLVPGKSTLEVTIRDANANIVRTETHVWSSSTWNLVAWANYTYNLANQLTGSTASNGATSSATYSGERKTSETDAAGIALTYTYDAADRVDTVTRAAAGTTIAELTTKFAYDAAHRVTQQTVGYGSSETLVSSKGYDTAGRVTSESSPGPNGAITASYAYNPAARQVTVSLPNGGSRTETYQLDGKPQSVTGTAVIPQYYTYAVQTGGVGYARINLISSGSSRLREAWTDWLGRSTRTSRPGFTGQSAFEEQSFYSASTGQLTKTTRTGLAATLYQYDSVAQPNRSGLDLNANDSLDLGGTDRIGDADQYFEYANNAWWLTKVARTYATASNSTATTVSTTRRRLSGFSGNLQAETSTTDVDGNTATRTVSVDRGAKTATVATVVTGIGNSQTEVYTNGFATSATGFDGLTYTHGYDALGRRTTTTAPRTGTTTTYYKSGSAAVWYIVDPANNTVATYTYDSAGRVTAVDNGGNITRTEYNTRDQVVHQWGSGAYPVEYGYNSYGERTTMSTYRGGSGWEGSSWPSGTAGTADTTNWTYDDPSGLLTSKADAKAKSVSYTYNSRGQVLTRTWARGVTTTYAYNSLTGELSGQTYSDATPAVSYAYTRAGQIDTVTDVTGTRGFLYVSHPLRLDAVSLPAFYGSRILTRQYDAIKRPAGFQLGVSGNFSGDLTQTYTYQTTTGRFDHLDTASAVQTSRTFNYTYNTAGLVGGLATGDSIFSVVREYEAHRNLLTSIESFWNSTSRTRYAYSYNTLGQRATAQQSGDVFSDFGGSTYYRYAYNGRGEVTQAVAYAGEDPASTSSPQLVARRFGYDYDNLGNRQSATRSVGTGVADLYTRNELNQYTQRENDLAYTAGTARTDSTIAISGGTTTATVGRAGRYWAAEVALANTTSPAKAGLSVTATLAGGLVRGDTRTAFLPASPQAFTYDDDGNLTGDGLWSYTYDAENRLITMTATTAAKNAGFADRLLEFKYDYLNRRVQKRSAILSGNGGFTPGETWRRYLYDGDNLVAEFDSTNTTIGTLLRSYTWGLDLAGSLSATGGVGALLQITEHTGTVASYFPTYDSNGNVAALLRGADGVAVAKYEYSPFGELLRSEGAYALTNPFRFSTKFTDDESGLVYYGHRYYSPSLGRFINRDPIAEQGGLNLYGFCGNDGINHWDILGDSWLSSALHRLGHWVTKHKREILTAVAVVAAVVVGFEVSSFLYTPATTSVTTVGIGIDSAVAGLPTTIAITTPATGALAGAVGAGTLSSAAASTIAGIAGGAMGGAVAGGIMTGTVKGALQGAAAGAIMGGIAGYYGNNYTLGRVGVTAVGGGLSSEIQGGSFRRGFELSGLIAFDTWAAVKAREYMWEQSNRYVDSNGVPVNATGNSVGYKGIGGKIGGVRAVVVGYDANGNPLLDFENGYLGGVQGGQGQTFGWTYAAGSVRDRVVEAYAGVHDFLNWPFSYNSMGNNEATAAPWGRVIASVAGAGTARFISGAMSWVNVPIATPIVLASAIPESAYPFLMNRPPKN